MKKVIGWFIIVFCSVMLFIFSISVLIMFFDDTGNIENPNKITTIIGFAIFITVSIFGLRYGLMQIKKEKIIETIEYNEVLDISFKGKIEFKAYRDLMLVLTFKRKLFVFVFFIIISSLMPLIAAGDAEVNAINYYYALFMVLLGLFIPVSTFYQIKKLYNTNSIFKETLTYHLTNASIQIIGDTVNSTQSWTHFVKIKETKSFFLFYHGSQVATLIEKRLFSEQQLTEFNTFTKSLAIPLE